jgi:hypothetical protein
MLYFRRLIYVSETATDFCIISPISTSIMVLLFQVNKDAGDILIEINGQLVGLVK